LIILERYPFQLDREDNVNVMPRYQFGYSAKSFARLGAKLAERVAVAVT